METEDRKMASPPGIRVPLGGSSCCVCKYQSSVDPSKCANPAYVEVVYRLGKKKGDDRFVDGKTGRHVRDPYSFCCNFFDW